MPFSSLSTLGKYQILAELGHGGFATAYRAHDPELGRDVALKILDPLLARDPVWSARFRREARAIASLDHTRIVTIYEIGQAEGALFIAMKLVEGGNLAQRLAASGALPWAEVARLASEIAEALDFAHAQGVLHRDLKPANVLLDPRTGAILTDFGLARMVADSSQSMSLTRGIVGTPAYVAPEVWEGKEVAAQTDVYALGCIVYEMATGQPRFAGETPPAVMLAHFQPPPLPATWPAGVPEGLAEVLATALARDPKARYARAGELAAALAALGQDPLAEPYQALQAALAAGEWRTAVALAGTNRAKDPSYRDVAALEKQALFEIDSAARREQASQWQQTATAALAAGNLDAARLAVRQWQQATPEDPEPAAFLVQLQETSPQTASEEPPVRSGSMALAPESASPIEPVARGAQGSKPRPRGLLVAGVLGALAIAALLLFVLRGGGDGEPEPVMAVTATFAVTTPSLVTPARTPTPEFTELPLIVDHDCGPGTRPLTIWADPDRASVFYEISAQVLEEANICLLVQELGFGDIRDKLNLQALAGKGPDIFVGAHDWLGELTAKGVVAELDLGTTKADFDPVALEAFSYNGTLYGMPYATENVALVCNKDLVPTPPTTYTELKTMAKKMQDAVTIKQFFAVIPGDAYHYEPINTAFGGYIFGQTAQGADACDVGLDNEGAVAGLTWIDGMVQDGLITPDLNWESAHVLFETGQAGCMITGPWALDRFRENKVNYSINAVPSEAQAGSPFVGVQGFMINAFSKNKVLAQSLLTDYVATTDVMEAIYKAGNRPPAYIPAQAAMDADAKAFAEVGKTGHPMPAIPAMSAVWDPWAAAITAVLQQSATLAKAAENAATQVRAAAGCQ